MPKIPIFDAGSGKLTPPEQGAQALSRAGMMEARYASETASGIKQEGAEIGRGIASIGVGINDYTEHAQAHTDALAETDADAQILSNKLNAQGAITDAATAHDPDGNPIPEAENPGFGGDKGFPPGSQVPTPEAVGAKASQTINQHQAAGQSILDRLDGQGVSDAAQQRINRKIQAANGELQLKAADQHSKAVAAHVINQTDESTRALLGDTNQHPENLDANLDQGHEFFKTLRGHASGEYVGPMDEKATEMESAFREATVTAAVEATARDGQPGAIDRATKLMDQYPKDVKNRDAMVTHITELANQGAKAASLAAEEKIRSDHAAMDVQSGKALAAGHPQDMALTPLGQQYPEKAAQLNAEQIAHREYSLHMNQPDPTTSYQNGQKLLAQGLAPGADPEATKAAAQAALISKDPAQRISVKDYEDIKKTLDDPNLKTFAKSTNDWLKNGEGRIDPNLGAGPLQGGRSILGQQQVQAWKDEVNRRYAADPAHGHDLLDPSKPGNMVSDQALGPYRITDQMKSRADAENANLDAAADQTQVNPQPLDNRDFVPRMLGINAPAPLMKDELGRIGGPTAQPITVPPSMSLLTTEGRAAAINNALKTYQPGTSLILPNGQKFVVPPAGTKMTFEGKTYTVPGTAAAPTGAPVQKMNYTPPAEMAAPAHAASVRNNNPGAQWPNALAKEYGATGHQNLADGNKIATFPTPMHGAAANMALFDTKYVGHTIEQIQKTWSGQHRAGLPGYAPGTRVTEAMAHDPQFMIPFMKAMAEAEAPRGSSVMSDAQWKQAFDFYQSKSSSNTGT
jgi:hypothetical protein